VCERGKGRALSTSLSMHAEACSTVSELLHAIGNANVSEILLTGPMYHIKQEMRIDRNLSISLLGVRSAKLISNSSRVMHIVSGGRVTLTGLELSGSTDESGGAVFNEEGVLELRNCSLSSSKALRDGGAIYSTGSLVIMDTKVGV
jgi:predicted outer membrane repeat protein